MVEAPSPLAPLDSPASSSAATTPTSALSSPSSEHMPLPSASSSAPPPKLSSVDTIRSQFIKEGLKHKVRQNLLGGGKAAKEKKSGARKERKRRADSDEGTPEAAAATPPIKTEPAEEATVKVRMHDPCPGVTIVFIESSGRRMGYFGSFCIVRIQS